MEYSPMISNIINALILSGLGYFIWSALGRVSNKLDTVLKNQENAAIERTALQKDVDHAKEKDRLHSADIVQHSKRIANLEKDNATLLEFKKNQERIK